MYSTIREGGTFYIQDLLLLKLAFIQDIFFHSCSYSYEFFIIITSVSGKLIFVNPFLNLEVV